MLEIGNYIRTVDGYIGRLIQINKRNWNYLTVDCKHQVRDGGIYPRSYLYLKEEDIKKYSKDVKDLIEIGDIVGLADENDELNYFEVYDNKALYQYEIKCIITKERIKSEEYEVGE